MNKVLQDGLWEGKLSGGNDDRTLPSAGGGVGWVADEATFGAQVIALGYSYDNDDIGAIVYSARLGIAARHLDVGGQGVVLVRGGSSEAEM